MRRHLLVLAIILLSVLASETLSTPAFALSDCGTDDNGTHTAKAHYVQVYASKYARWCVDTSAWPSDSEHISQFFAYYDGVVPRLMSLFNVKIPLTIVVEVTTSTGVACACGPKFGAGKSVRIGVNNFSSTFVSQKDKLNIPGFWGYLLILHESINIVTGVVGGGWPSDWWADHRSPFPNMIDEQVMRTIGQKQRNQILTDAAAAHHERFADPSRPGPGQDRYDPEVGMFDRLFNQFGGYDAFSRFFRLVEGDKLSWRTVNHGAALPPDHNHGKLLSEYVIAYLSLAFGTTTDLTPTFAEAGVGTLDKTIESYTLDSAAVRTIANAHCSIHAAGPAGASRLKPLQEGNFRSALAPGGTRQACPSECAWKENKCLAKW